MYELKLLKNNSLKKCGTKNFLRLSDSFPLQYLHLFKGHIIQRCTIPKCHSDPTIEKMVQ